MNTEPFLDHNLAYTCAEMSHSYGKAENYVLDFFYLSE